MVGKRSTARFANGAVSAVLVVFFLAHGVLGSLALVFGIIGPLAWLFWVGVALVAVHVVMSVVTSREQLSDAQRPPSPRKKRHLALKWATGALLAACIAVHVASSNALIARLAIVALAIALAAHLCVGSKSLLTDLGADRRYKNAFRAAACAFAALFVVAVLASAFQAA